MLHRKKKNLTPDELKAKLRNDFLAACERGKTDEVRKLIAEGVDVNTPGDTGRSGLYYAVVNGNIETARVLLNSGANPNARVSDVIVNPFETSESTPLLLALQRNFSTMADLLLSHGADVKAKDSFDLTALHYAAKRGNFDMAVKLIGKGAELEPRDKWNNTPEHYARDNGYKTLANYLLKQAGHPLPPEPPRPKL